MKLLDFGIAAHVGPDAATRTKLTQQGMVLGTPPYMSPEQLAGEKLGPSSDIYSLGIIAYEMLTGHLPFEADTPWLWAHKHMTEAPRPMESFEAGRALPESVRSAVMHALAKTPAERPSSTLELYREMSGASPTQGVVGPVQTEPGYDVGPRTSPMPALQPVAAPAQTVSPAYQTASALAAPVVVRQVAPPKRRGWIAAVVALLVAGGALATGVVVVQQRQSGSLEAGGAGGVTASMPSATTQIAPLVDAAEPTQLPVSNPPPPVQQTPARVVHHTPEKPKPQKPPPSAAPPPILPAPQASSTPSKPPTFPRITLPGLPLPTYTSRPAPKPVPKPAPTPAPPKPVGPTGDAACNQSKSLASSGNIEAAVALYRRCQSTGGSATATRAAFVRIQVRAAQVVQSRAFNGNCAGARSAAAAASSIGAGSRAQAQLRQTKCR